VPPTEPPPGQDKDEEGLATTGLNVILPLGTAAALIFAGAVILVISRARRSGRDG
jgi:hypothetical protein